MEKMILIGSLGLALAIAPGFAEDRERALRFRTVDYPGSVSTQIAGINNRGELTGAYVDSGSANRAFYQSGRMLRTVPATGEVFSESDHSNERGIVVGDYVDAVNFNDHAFLFQNGRLTTLPDYPGATVTSGIDIDASGARILGLYTLDPAQATGFHGALFSGGKWTLSFAFPGANVTDTFPLGMNDQGWIVGSYKTTTPGEEHGFIRRPDGAFFRLDFPKAAQTEAFDINNPGDIVGRYTDTAGKTHGFLLAGGRSTSIDYPGASFTYTFGINDPGDIVGWYQTAPGPNFHGLVLTRRDD
jgi:probable HAF family extracellular repeat protein